MKLSLLTIVLSLLLPLLLLGQSKDYNKYLKNASYKASYIMHYDSVKEEGLISKNGYKSFTFISKDGAKTKYKPKQVLGYSRGNTRYYSSASSFYEIVVYSSKIGFFRKGFSYRHANPAGGMSTSSNISSKTILYLLKPGESNIFEFEERELNQKKTRQIIADFFDGCELLKPMISKEKLKYSDLLKLVHDYNILCK